MTRSEIMALAVMLPEHERRKLVADLTATLPLPYCFTTTPALMVASAKRLSALEVEEVIALLQASRPS